MQGALGDRPPRSGLIDDGLRKTPCVQKIVSVQMRHLDAWGQAPQCLIHQAGLAGAPGTVDQNRIDRRLARRQRPRQNLGNAPQQPIPACQFRRRIPRAGIKQDVNV